jgi:hypothetical protein
LGREKRPQQSREYAGDRDNHEQALAQAGIGIAQQRGLYTLLRVFCTVRPVNARLTQCVLS